MPRSNRPLRFGRKRSIKFPQYADDVLVSMAKRKGITTSHMVRRIVLRQVHIYLESQKKDAEWLKSVYPEKK